MALTPVSFCHLVGLLLDSTQTPQKLQSEAFPGTSTTLESPFPHPRWTVGSREHETWQRGFERQMAQVTPRA